MLEASGRRQVCAEALHNLLPGVQINKVLSVSIEQSETYLARGP